MNIASAASHTFTPGQTSAQANLTSSTFSDGSDRQSLTYSVGSKHEFGQIEDIFADESMPSRSSGPWHTRPPAAGTGSIPLSNDDRLQNVPRPHLHDSHRKSP